MHGKIVKQWVTLHHNNNRASDGLKVEEKVSVKHSSCFFCWNQLNIGEISVHVSVYVWASVVLYCFLLVFSPPGLQSASCESPVNVLRIRLYCALLTDTDVLSSPWKDWLTHWLSACLTESCLSVKPLHVNFKSQLCSSEHVAAKGKALHCHQHHTAASGCCAIWH